MATILNLLTYFFEPLPIGPFKYMNFFIIVAVGSLVVSIGLRIYLKKRKDDKIFRKLFRQLPGQLQLFALTEALYLLVRYERMPYLSTRILHYFIWAYGLYVLFKATRTYLQAYPALKKHHDNQQKLNQYLPRKQK